ncbi:PREDICTED: CD209 antigen-like protein D [Cyprinodon variegatus]|uniref:CD209 antigen-like protein D n=1 Tax=Cyprinodon variegatus TaxID=28743 RepID=UPI0007424D96|nr:PREDICTED: CD209 antigen-like protein D [Cyprinodon variegatus]
MKELLDHTTNTIYSEASPDSGYENIQTEDWQEIRTSRLFYTSTEKKNWTESRKDCQRRGGDLVIINIKEKQDILRRMKLHGDSWIGLQSVNNTGGRGAKKWKWQWVDGSELEYKFWKNGVSTTAEAGSKAYIDQQFLWMHSKTELKHWICEKINISHTGVIHT